MEHSIVSYSKFPFGTKYLLFIYLGIDGDADGDTEWGTEVLFFPYNNYLQRKWLQLRIHETSLDVSSNLFSSQVIGF